MAYKILIVDDSKLARMAVGKVLSGLRPNWTRVEATNADEAMALARQSSFDIALLDFNMPGRDGLSLAGDLREMSPEMPVAVISANVQHEVIQKANEVGAQFLPKPLTEDAMRAFIDHAEQRLETASR
ncbi:MAG TPA: response regulator [Phenylobacterium sp.]